MLATVIAAAVMACSSGTSDNDEEDSGSAPTSGTEVATIVAGVYVIESIADVDGDLVLGPFDNPLDTPFRLIITDSPTLMATDDCMSLVNGQVNLVEQSDGSMIAEELVPEAQNMADCEPRVAVESALFVAGDETTLVVEYGGRTTTLKLTDEPCSVDLLPDACGGE